MNSFFEPRGRFGGVAAAAALAVASLFGTAGSASAASYYQNYLVQPAYDISSIVLYQKTETGGGTTNSFDVFAPETLITDPFVKLDPITGTYFLGVSTLGSQDEEPTNHLVLAFNDSFASTIITGGLDFADIFTGFDESSLIEALLTLSSSESSELAIENASDLIFNFSDAVTDLGGLFGSVDTFSLVSFSTGSDAGAGYSYTTSVGGVPEPDAWALMILGFGGAGAVLRRRRATTRAMA